MKTDKKLQNFGQMMMETNKWQSNEFGRFINMQIARQCFVFPIDSLINGGPTLLMAHSIIFALKTAKCLLLYWSIQSLHSIVTFPLTDLHRHLIASFYGFSKEKSLNFDLIFCLFNSLYLPIVRFFFIFFSSII